MQCMNVFDLLEKTAPNAVLKGRIVYHTPYSMQFSVTNKPRTRIEFESERLGSFAGFMLDDSLELLLDKNDAVPV